MDDSTRPFDPPEDVLSTDIADLGIHIADVVSEALEKFKVKAVDASESSMWFTHVLRLIPSWRS
jgi:hypothetical protein